MGARFNAQPSLLILELLHLFRHLSFFFKKFLRLLVFSSFQLARGFVRSEELLLRRPFFFSVALIPATSFPSVSRFLLLLVSLSYVLVAFQLVEE